MSRVTPRKSRHRAQPSGGGGAHGPRTVAASDYESDATHYLETRGTPPAPQIPYRTNTELNLSVLQRYLPNIRSIVSIAASAVVYVITPSTLEWEKSGAEGTLFVCEQDPLIVDGHALPQACVFVLNRKGLDNLVIDLAKVSVCEVQDSLLIFKVEDDGSGIAGYEVGDEDPEVIGLWIHNDEDDTQQVNYGIIQESWRQIRAVLEATVGAATMGVGEPPVEKDSTEPPIQARGRRVSISDLFGQSMGGGSNGA